MRKAFVILCLCAVCACTMTTQKPTAEVPSCQVVDNSQTTIIIGDNNSATPIATPSTSNTPSATIDAESTNETSNAWVLWLLLALATLGVGFYLWRRYLK